MKLFDPKAQPAKLEVVRLDDLDDGEFTAPEPDELEDEEEEEDDEDEEDDEEEGDEAAGDEGIDDVQPL